LTGQVNLATETLAVYLIGGYTPDFDAHQTLTDVFNVGGVMIGSGVLENVSVVNGVLDADDITFTGVDPGLEISGVVLAHGGAGKLVFYQTSVNGLPASTTGADITLIWPNTGNKIMGGP